MSHTKFNRESPESKTLISTFMFSWDDSGGGLDTFTFEIDGTVLATNIYGNSGNE